MKTILKANINLTFSIFFLFIVNVNAQENGKWEILNEGFGEMREIYFVGENNGWILSRSNLWNTEDGGKTWKNISLPEGLDLYNIKFTSAAVGWVVGSSGENPNRNIYKTLDGGLTWSLLSDLPDLYFNIDAVNDSVVFVVGYSTSHCAGRIFKTTNGGKSWIDITPLNIVNDIDLIPIYFFDQYKGLVQGGCYNNNRKILKTFDGGLNWEIQTLPLPFSFLFNTQIVNDSTIYFIAQNAAEPPFLYYLGYTSDMFDSWTIVYESENSFNFYALDQDYIFASIEDSHGNLYIMRSTDGGYTWQKKQSIWGGNGQIYFNTPRSGFILGNGFYRSTDGGENWIFNNFTEDFRDVFFIDDKIGFAGTMLYTHLGPDGGVIYKTTDGGITWNHHANKPAMSLFFVNDLIGYSLHPWIIFRTIDQGQQWTEVYRNNPDSTGYNFDGNLINFINDKIGWVVGSGSWANDSSGAGILGTTDGGENWDLIWKYTNTDEYGYELNSIQTFETEAWAVGESGLIVKYTEQNQWQLQSAVTDLPLNDVFFSDELHGWIAGGYFDWNLNENHLILLKTVNGGDTWEEKRDFNYEINDMFFDDSLCGWAVGSDTSGSGIILGTIDGGGNWTAQVEDLSGPLNAIHFKDGYGWAVGEKGQVLRTEDGASWVDQNTGKTYPNKFSLSKNYPNPFNPSTKIKFTLPKAEKVKIELFNTLGQKVETLLNKAMKAGHHEVEFNAQNLSSGIYYRIEAGEFQDVKKMILLR
jgi:photosystem II stability/assembly factor-like uncharacterized protein